MHKVLFSLLLALFMAFQCGATEIGHINSELQISKVLLVDDDDDGYDETDDCPNEFGNSSKDRIGCIDSDGDGYSDPSTNWNLSDGADAFPLQSVA